jgi:hypothetical protein
MEGALETPGVVSRPWPARHKETFQTEVRELLDAGAARTSTTPPKPGEPYDSATQDPVVTPPLYGAWPAEVTAVPDAGWVAGVNLHPVRRAAAGLGGRVVRDTQEALVAAAWEQSGALRETVSTLNRGRLAVEVGRSWARRASELADSDLLQLTSRIQAFLPSGSTTVRARLAASAVPGGVISAAYLRQTRSSTPLARDWRALAASDSARLGADHTAINVAATALDPDPGLAAALEFAAVGAPSGAWLGDATLSDIVEPVVADEGIAVEIERTRRAARVEGSPVPVGEQAPAPPPIGTAIADVSGIAGTVRDVLDPLASVRASVLLRIPALEGLVAAGALPTTVPIGPVFEDALYRDLVRLGASWLLPGVEELRRNRVRLVATNPTFVGSFLIGANHELARELLWRDYPVDLRATFFQRFWNYLGTEESPPRVDIVPLHDWEPEDSIVENMEAAGEAVSTVIVVRGDVVRRYPTAHYFLQPALSTGEEWEPDDAEAPVEAIFLGSLDRETVFYGFELGPDVVRGDRANGVPGYFLAIEEQVGAPRFGLDQARAGHFTATPRNWNGLAWGHLVSSRDELDALTHARADNERLAGLTINGITWGENAAHLARACWQRPFRMYIHADLLV